MFGSQRVNDTFLIVAFAAAVLTMPIWLAPIGAAYPDLLQKFAIFGLFAIGFNLLFGLTGYLSFGHAAFLGVGSYTAVWSFKLLSMNILPALMLVQQATLAEYHEYAVEWNEEGDLLFLLDGNEVFRSEGEGDLFPEPLFAILNFAKINDAPMTQTWEMEVDWVKHEALR